MTALSASESRLENMKALSNALFYGKVTPHEAKLRLDKYIIETEKEASTVEAARIEIVLTMSPAEDLKAVAARVKAGTITTRELSETLDCIIAVLDDNE